MDVASDYRVQEHMHFVFLPHPLALYKLALEAHHIAAHYREVASSILHV